MRHFYSSFFFSKGSECACFCLLFGKYWPGQVTFWLGSYHAGTPQGYIELNDGSTTVTANFTSTTYANTPSTLTTSDCTYIPFSGYTSASVTGWQEATITGLTVATILGDMSVQDVLQPGLLLLVPRKYKYH